MSYDGNNKEPLNAELNRAAAAMYADGIINTLKHLNGIMSEAYVNTAVNMKIPNITLILVPSSILPDKDGSYMILTEDGSWAEAEYRKETGWVQYRWSVTNPKVVFWANVSDSVGAFNEKCAPD